MTKYKDNEAYENDKAKLSKPLPVVRDKNGKPIKDYMPLDWFAKLNEELDEVKTTWADDGDLDRMEETIEGFKTACICEELQDLITVCVSCMQYLGYDEKARDELCKEVNEKNRRRGYLDDTTVNKN